jgi:flagellar biosynthesis/type III secretory pathway M-ring protein FliF/YscJ
MRLTEKPSKEATELEALIKKELDAVIGNRFKMVRSVAKWALGAALAIVTAVIFALVLHTHLGQSSATPAPARPVVIQILPAR